MSETLTLPLEEVIALKPHPVADLFPMLLDSADPPAGYEGMTMPQFASLILKEGVKVPLVIWNGMLLDGRNRREGAKQASKVNPAGLSFVPADLSKLPVRYMEFKSDEEADEWVLSINLDRRQMNKDQMACLAAQYWDVEAERAKSRKEASRFGSEEWESGEVINGRTENGKTSEILGRRFHVSAPYVQKARSLWLNDRAKFERARSGQERVISKLVNPQKIKPDKDQDESYLEGIRDARAKGKSAITINAENSAAKRTYIEVIDTINQLHVDLLAHAKAEYERMGRNLLANPSIKVDPEENRNQWDNIESRNRQDGIK